MKVVINACFGGFSLSDQAYEWLIEHGIPVKKYIQQKRGKDGRYLPEPLNEGEIIFDCQLSDGELRFSRYWDAWTDSNRTHSLVIGVVEALGNKASGRFAELKVVKIPDGIEWEIDEYDGYEQINEKHRTWR